MTLIQDLHAAISRRDWHAVEVAANRLRDTNLEADNEALTARVKELEKVNAKLCDDAIDYELKVAERDISLKALETHLAALKDAAKSVEDWWLSEGMNHFPGAPYCIFAIRAALEDRP
ncbi:hypothetical protein DEA98_14050 [Brucella pseudogrignonensis]|uniref:Uncharacterized protein n=1 Tax=Brucella pseudogrignonensis TaxID=419475 RepID=A0A7Y3T4J9_9HYPH|nr:hypothetical protein [Brucella pseudogrignonensis]MCM0751991.1 hypothetical protein [Brucella pseudogrignonensis]NNV20581.1 hypothetical protein [Brucella pseudogrignonensis]